MEAQLLVRALADRGIEAAPVVWDDPNVEWEGFSLVVVRSTWDYVARRSQFVAWAKLVEADAAILNSPELLRWTTDKHYLLDLAAAGVATVATTFLDPGDGDGWQPPAGEYVVKPAVSAGSQDTARYSSGDDVGATAHLQRLLADGRSVMVQPYLRDVDVRGETALIYVDGEFSHAIRKGPLLRAGAGLVEGLYAEEEISVRVPGAAELSLGASAMAAIPTEGSVPPLYARVDLVRGDDGSYQVLELELAEPSLFLDQHGPSADRLGAAIARRLSSM